MVELVEDCLYHIFGYLTPVEWIQIYDVSKFWRMVVQRKWQKITEISYLDSERFFKTPPVVIPVKDAKNMMLRAAEFSNILKVHLSAKLCTASKFITFGPFQYVLKNSNIGRLLQSFAEIATELTEVAFSEPPTKELLQLLFEKNKIKNIKIAKVDTCNGFWGDISTDGIDKLDLNIENPCWDFKSFEGLFPNLRTLVLGLVYDYYQGPTNCYEKVLLQILPFIPHLKTLDLKLYFRQLENITLHDIIQLPHLEKLSLRTDGMGPEGFTPALFTNFTEFCPALRVIELDFLAVTDDLLHAVLSLPNLEKLNVDFSTEEFQFMKELPEMVKLTEFAIAFEKSSLLNVTNFFDAIKKMPNLKKLHVSFLSKEQTLKFTCKAIVTAASQNKDVVVEKNFIGEGYKRLKVESKHSDEKFQILSLRIRRSSATYFDDVTAFVQKNLKNYRAFMLNDE